MVVVVVVLLESCLLVVVVGKLNCVKDLGVCWEKVLNSWFLFILCLELFWYRDFAELCV